MARNNDVFDPTFLPWALRRMAIQLVFGVGLLIVSVVIATFVNVQHTTDVVGGQQTLLGRGDCRSAALADSLTDLANFGIDLADLLQHAATPQGRTERLKIPADAVAMKDHSDQMSAAADRYNKCGDINGSSVTTTTKGT